MSPRCLRVLLVTGIAGAVVLALAEPQARIVPANDAAEPSATSVEAAGSAVIGSSVEDARRGAVEEALLAAVETSAGVDIDARTLTLDGEIADRELVARARGSVLDYQVLEERRSGDRISVRVRARVQAGARVRVPPLPVPWTVHLLLDPRIAVPSLAELLSRPAPDLARFELTVGRPDLTAVAPSAPGSGHRIFVEVTGDITVAVADPATLGHPIPAEATFPIAETRVRIRLFDGHDGRLLASRSLSARAGASDDPATARARSVIAVGHRVREELGRILAGEAARRSRSFRLTVRTSARKAAAIDELLTALEGHRWIDGVALQESRPGIAEVRITTRVGPETVIAELRRRRLLHIDTVDLGAGRVVARLPR